MSKNNEIKPTDIFDIMDLAKKARGEDLRFTPLFAGDAGIGKSEICQQWVKKEQARNPQFFFLDLRLAYMEPPDLIGLPKLIEVEGKTRTTHVLPDFWPGETAEGLILFEEPNRANSSMMNCMMQILTDRKVGQYTLPKGVIMAACINPEGNYDVNTMDVALKDRFEIYDVGYKFEVFKDFMDEHDWHPHIQSFVKSGIWLHKKPDELGEDGQYISPRTWSKLNTALSVGVDKKPNVYYNTILAILGKNVGREFYKFVSDNKPVLAQDFIDNKKDAFKRLKAISDKEGYRGDLINIIIDSLSDAYETEINDEIILEVVKIIPKDQAVNLLKACVMKSKVKDKDLSHFVKLDPSLKGILKSVLRG